MWTCCRLCIRLNVKYTTFPPKQGAKWQNVEYKEGRKAKKGERKKWSKGRKSDLTAVRLRLPAKLCGNIEQSVCRPAHLSRGLDQVEAFHLPTNSLTLLHTHTRARMDTQSPLLQWGSVMGGYLYSWPASSDNCFLWICHCHNSQFAAIDKQWAAMPGRPLGNIPLLVCGWMKRKKKKI